MKILAKGNSMFPIMKNGEYYDLLEVIFGQICIGDIIVYQIDNMFICHRVIKIIYSKKGTIFYKTKGDNCDVPDPYAITHEQIIGKIVV
ncbi:MAG: signal peptidase I [Lachnospiraceae bacterium]|nr:signal peptidase I [Lachnospiraceae bacterium]